MWNAEKNPVCRSNYGYINKYYRDHRDNKFPFIITLTPFPNTDVIPPLVLYNKQSVSRCSCGFFLSKYVKFENNEWTCPVCSNRVVCETLSDYTKQTQSSFFDIPDLNDSGIIKPVSYEPTLFFFVIELSETTKSTGIFDKVLDKILEMMYSTRYGYCAVFVFNNGVTYPMFTSSKNYSISTSPNLSDIIRDDFVYHVFDMAKQFELFADFIYRIKKLDPEPVSSTLCDMLGVIDTFSSYDSVYTILLISETDISGIGKLLDNAIERTFCGYAIDIFYYVPTYKNIDLFDLSLYSLCGHSLFKVYRDEQINLIPDDIIDRSRIPHLSKGRVVVMSSKSVKVTDIFGPGVRQSEKSYIISSLTTGTTIYFIFEYNVREIKEPVHIQFLLLFNDCAYTRFLRVVNYMQPIHTDSSVILNYQDYSLVLASEVMYAIERLKFGRRMDEYSNSLQMAKNKYIKNTDVFRTINGKCSIERAQIIGGLAAAQLAVESHQLPSFSVGTPLDISKSVCPHVYRFEIDGMFTGPMPIGGLELEKSVFFILYSERKSLLLIPESENMSEWLRILADETSILLKNIDSLAPGSIVEVLSLLENSFHPLVTYMQKLASFSPPV